MVYGHVVSYRVGKRTIIFVDIILKYVIFTFVLSRMSFGLNYVFGGGMVTPNPLPHGGSSRPCEVVLA